MPRQSSFERFRSAPPSGARVASILGPCPRLGVIAVSMLGFASGCGLAGKPTSELSDAGAGGGPGSIGNPGGGGASRDGTGGSLDAEGSGGSTGQSESSGGAGNLGSGGSAPDGAGGNQAKYEYGAEISVVGRRVLVGGAPLEIRGVCWNPVGKGGDHPADIDFSGLSEVDIPLMQAAGINVVRTYEPLLDIEVLDQLAAAHIYLIQSVFPFGEDPNVVVDRVSATRTHPAVLMWSIGNEWNYNGFYADVPFEQAVTNIQQAITLIRQLDTTHPIATIYGELPDADLLSQLSGIDVWGINAYRGISFGGLLEDFAELSQKPLFLAEFGADAWDSRNGGAYSPDTQAEATGALILELLDSSAARSESGIVLGGTIFEWADEWWKAGAPDVHDTGGVAPGGGPYPDATFNEEWWGLLDVDRNPRPAYEVMKEIYTAE